MKQKILNLVILFLALYFFISDITILNQIEILVVLNLKGLKQKNISN